MPKNNWIKLSIEENTQHIERINSELGKVKEDIAQLKTDVNWIKKLLWPILGGVAALVFKIYLGG